MVSPEGDPHIYGNYRMELSPQGSEERTDFSINYAGNSSYLFEQNLKLDPHEGEECFKTGL